MQSTSSPLYLNRTLAFLQFCHRTRPHLLQYPRFFTCVVRTKQCSGADVARNCHLSVRTPVLSQAQQISPKPQSEEIAEQPKPLPYRLSRKDSPSNKPLVNRFLASKRLSLTFIIAAAFLYVASACLIASTIANASLRAHERILLFGLGVLLPDFRHTLIYYYDAVQDLHEYKPAFRAFSFSSKTKSPTIDTEDSEEPAKSLPRPELLWLMKASQDFHDQIRSGFQEGAKQIDKLVGVPGRELANGLTRPIRETGTHFQQLTTGTDLTLRKNVLIATASILLSIAGYFISTVVDPGVGGVSVMLASLLSSAVLSSRRHEMLALLNDGRVVISLVGTLSCAILTLAPTAAAYCFMLCCVALVTTRFTVDWLKVFK